MDRQKILLAKSFEAVGIELRTDNFDNRLILQKAVYILQQAGIQLGYRYGWYLRGPYSPELTNDVFSVLKEGEEAEKELKRWRLDNNLSGLLQNLKPLLVVEGESTEEQSKRLELIASVLFLLKTNQAKETDHERTSLILKKNGKNFDTNQVEQAITELKQYSLLKQS